MKQHIEIVKKWLADKDSVSLEELKANADAANADVSAYADAYAAYADAAEAADAAADAAAYAAHDVAYYIKRYEELTK